MTFIPVPEVFICILSIGYKQNHTWGIYPGYYHTRSFCTFCRTLILVPGTSVTSVIRCHKDPGYGCSILYLPGSSVSSVRPCHNTRNFWKFCKTFIPVPGTFGKVLLLFHTRIRNFCEFCRSRATIPGLRLKHVLYPPGTSVSYVCLYHNTRNFCEFCNTSIPVPETPLPLPGISTNPTEHNLANMCE